MFQYPLEGLQRFSGTPGWYYGSLIEEGDFRHTGQDWSGDEGVGNTDVGAPVRAAGQGVVAYAQDFGPGWGNVIILNHIENGIVFSSTIYGHLDTIEVAVGANVVQGQVIGAIGDGNGEYLDDARLHFGVFAGALTPPLLNHFAPDPFSIGYLDPNNFFEYPSIVYGRDSGALVDDVGQSALFGGYGGADHLFGQAGNDWLEGLSGDDFLIGGTGNDTMLGGTGSDIYLVDSIADIVIETGGPEPDFPAGVDTVRSEVSWTLGDFVERLVLTGTLRLDGSGNALDNVIFGNDTANTLEGRDGDDGLMGEGGNDTIRGGLGNDFLGGGLGNDTLIDSSGLDVFVFNTAPSASNVDTIVGFDASDDMIYLDIEVFTALGATGALAGEAFNNGSSASELNDRIVYDASTRTLYYDADGLGSVSGKVAFATLELPVGTLTADNFWIV
jgi:Ca2+-binding RTX toxin-like protein